MNLHSDTVTDTKKGNCSTLSPHAAEAIQHWMRKLAEIRAIAESNDREAIEHHLLRLLYQYEIIPQQDMLFRQIGWLILQDWPTAWSLAAKCRENLAYPRSTVSPMG